MLDDYPDTFTSIQIHTGGAGPVTAWGNARRTFYGVSGIPDAWFDGKEQATGAYTNVDTQYNWYRGIYLDRLAVTSDIKLELGGELISGQTYEIKVRVTNDPVGTPQEWTVAIHMAQLLDNYPTYGGYHRNCCKGGPASEVITLAPDESIVLTREITFDAVSWANQSNIKIAAFAQNDKADPPARVHNATVMNWPFTPLQEYEVGDLNCDGAINGFDIDAFIMVLEEGPPYTTYYATYPNCDHMLADCNDDGDVNGFDIDAFIVLLGG
ncbi:MAG: hypothetical protein KKB50_20815 [Planctomycetes bacterium]|nr:hypothetical protein [Planctomycetota bacterium]